MTLSHPLKIVQFHIFRFFWCQNTEILILKKKNGEVLTPAKKGFNIRFFPGRLQIGLTALQLPGQNRIFPPTFTPYTATQRHITRSPMHRWQASHRKRHAHHTRRHLKDWILSEVLPVCLWDATHLDHPPMIDSVPVLYDTQHHAATTRDMILCTNISMRTDDTLALRTTQRVNDLLLDRILSHDAHLLLITSCYAILRSVYQERGKPFASCSRHVQTSLRSLRDGTTTLHWVPFRTFGATASTYQRACLIYTYNPTPSWLQFSDQLRDTIPTKFC